ncbi:MAG: RHS repeat-associated core domain-containing protein [Pirellulales bacterium]|nr:RHS repeat-associated core domain-containing protein [Pirellulales bacterium]
MCINTKSSYSYTLYLDDMRFSDSETVQYNALKGGSLGQIAAEYTLGDFPSKTVKWLHYDQLGNVAGKSGSAGTSTDSYHQDAYGNVISNINTGQWASSFSGRHLTTKEYDANCHLHYFWHRWYDGEVGRFLAVDPEWRIDHGYTLAEGNPLSWVDPTGRAATPTPDVRLPKPAGAKDCDETHCVTGPCDKPKDLDKMKDRIKCVIDKLTAQPDQDIHNVSTVPL